jgi:hypothetical protein
MKNQRLKTGIFIAILGIASILISQTADFSYSVYRDRHRPEGTVYDSDYDYYYRTDLKNGLLYGGIVILIIGAGIAAFSTSEQTKK